MRPCLSQSTVMKAPTETFFEAAARAGFVDVELRFSCLEEVLAFRRARDLRDLASRLGLRLVTLNSLEEFSLFPEENLAVMDHRVQGLLATCALLQVPVLVTVPSRLAAPLPQREVRARTVERLRRYATWAARFGVTLAFEPIGTPGFSVRTTAEAVAIVQEVAMENVRLTLDTINAYQGGDSPAAWEHVPPELLAIVHFHDSEPGPVDRLTLGSRLLPGEGVIDLAGFASALRELGYTGAVSVELFNERIWAMPPVEAAQAAMASLQPFVGRPSALRG